MWKIGMYISNLDTKEDSKKPELIHCLFWIRDRSGFPIFPIIENVFFFFSKHRDTKLTSAYSVLYLFLPRLLLSPPPPLSPL